VSSKDELDVRQRARQRLHDHALPFGVEVQVYLVNEDDAIVVDELRPARRAHVDVVKQVSDPADVGAVTVRERAELGGHAVDLEQTVALLVFALEQCPLRQPLFTLPGY
jgi:hypothetical protein